MCIVYSTCTTGTTITYSVQCKQQPGVLHCICFTVLSLMWKKKDQTQPSIVHCVHWRSKSTHTWSTASAPQSRHWSVGSDPTGGPGTKVTNGLLTQKRTKSCRKWMLLIIKCNFHTYFFSWWSTGTGIYQGETKKERCITKTDRLETNKLILT